MTFLGIRTVNRVLIYIVLCILFISVTAESVSAGSDEAIRSVQNDNMNIALTFDDGPHPIFTREILGILDEYNIRATFFIIGDNAKREPNLVAEIAEHGHELGNHTLNHDKPWRLEKSDLLGELKSTAEIICDSCGTVPTVFRPPEGVISGYITPCAVEMGYNIVLWSVDTRDWEKSTSVESVVANIRENIDSGGIILCHDSVSKKTSVTPAALKIIIPYLLDRGYNFVTVSELISS